MTPFLVSLLRYQSVINVKNDVSVLTRYLITRVNVNTRSANYSRKGRFTLTRTIGANNSRERSRSTFGLNIHIHANANARANCSREQFASFALSNAIRANNLRIKLIFDEYFTY